MTDKKDLKRRVRARMAKTGESYAAARAQLLAKREPRPAEYAELAGMSDEAVRKRPARRGKGGFRPSTRSMPRR